MDHKNSKKFYNKFHTIFKKFMLLEFYLFGYELIRNLKLMVQF